MDSFSVESYISAAAIGPVDRATTQTVQVKKQARVKQQLEKFSLDQTKLCELEQLQATWESISSTSNKEMVHMDAISNSNELVIDGQIQWILVETNGFELSEDKTEIRCLKAGWYILSLAVFLTPKTANATVELQVNGTSIRRDRATLANHPSSISCVRSSYLKAGAVLKVVVPSSQDVGAALTAAKIMG
ncbi:hypothetical protein GN244_ATG03234 [Phytophthora infestans]|uniref:Uncharacterized protein n=1 Tax=Phytophthora infestans TaxID=4787 RepID=A0A833WNT9_PHYIN|nr:hypothetical protein GN244_ATG03234 [Phytophthora infestans]KAF4147670.1 hypothetical protein GN958_ATG03025 [Phytophthora infestans]